MLTSQELVNESRNKDPQAMVTRSSKQTNYTAFNLHLYLVFAAMRREARAISTLQIMVAFAAC